MFEKNPDNCIDVTAGGAAALADDDFASAGESASSAPEISTPPKSDKRGYVNLGRGNDSQKGQLIVIEGLDGSGKETQANLLRASLIERGVDLRSVSFPRYDSPSSALVRMYLGVPKKRLMRSSSTG